MITLGIFMILIFYKSRTSEIQNTADQKENSVCSELQTRRKVYFKEVALEIEFYFFPNYFSWSSFFYFELISFIKLLQVIQITSKIKHCNWWFLYLILQKLHDDTDYRTQWVTTHKSGSMCNHPEPSENPEAIK